MSAYSASNHMRSNNCQPHNGFDATSLPSLSGLRNEKVTSRIGEATECSDDTSVPAGSSIEVTRVNGDVLHYDTLLITKQMTGLRKETLEVARRV